jgi:cleavage and polyadenylation specificity factor subunit 3
MAMQAMPVYQSYIEMMNEDIRKAFKVRGGTLSFLLRAYLTKHLREHKILFKPPFKQLLCPPSQPSVVSHFLCLLFFFFPHKPPQVRNPFSFKYIHVKDKSSQLDDLPGPSIVLATPSTLMSGTSRELLERWCEDERNGLIIVDFAVAGTMAREVLANPRTIPSREGRTLPFKMTVEAISFSAHADFPQTAEFLDILRPPHVVLVHGEKTGMEKLAKELESRAKAQGFPRILHTPGVGASVSFPHRAERVAKVAGRLAEKGPAEGRALKGVLVRKGAQDLLLHPEDLSTYTKLKTCALRHRQMVPVDHRPFSDIRFALEAMFEGVAFIRGHTSTSEIGGESAAAAGTSGAMGEGPSSSYIPGEESAAGAEPEALRIGDTITLTYKAPGSSSTGGGGGGYSGGYVLIEWEAGTVADMLADGVVAVILQAKGEPKTLVAAEAARRAAYKRDDYHSANVAELHILAEMLAAQFGPADVDDEELMIVVNTDGRKVVVDHRDKTVECYEDPALRERVERAVRRVEEAMMPLALYEE